MAILVLGVMVLVVVSFGLGRYLLGPWTVLQVLGGQIIDIPVTWTATEQTVVMQVRLPRILAALLVGAALSAAGAAYQTAFRNPLVSPEILGVAAAAGFGASLALLLGLAPGVLQVLAFRFRQRGPHPQRGRRSCRCRAFGAHDHPPTRPRPELCQPGGPDARRRDRRRRATCAGRHQRQPQPVVRHTDPRCPGGVTRPGCATFGPDVPTGSDVDSGPRRRDEWRGPTRS